MKKFLLTLLVSLALLSSGGGVYAANTQITSNKPVAVKHVFKVHGLVCPFCVIGIKKTFKKIKAVQRVEVSLRHNTVTVYTNRGICFSDKELKKIISSAGFSYKGTLVKPKDCGKRS